MGNTVLYAAGSAPALRYACQLLSKRYPLWDQPGPDVTHLLLPVPSFEADGRIRGGGLLEHILADLPADVTVIGGNLEHPALTGYHCLDLLRREEYLIPNAAITADCAIRVAGQHLPVTFCDCPILILGWGRIGKCLAEKLRALGARVTVSARSNRDRCLLRALGYGAVDPSEAARALADCRVVFNTVPAPLLAETPPGILNIDLASRPGILGKDVLRASGLPGKLTPESAGTLIAENTIHYLEECKEDTL